MDRLVLIFVLTIAVCCTSFSDGKVYHIHKIEKFENGEQVATFYINGEGIADSFTTRGYSLVDKESLANGVLIIGDYRRNSVSVYSDQPGTMVVISGDTKQCELMKYPRVTGYSFKVTGDITEADCDDVKSHVEAAWDRETKTFSWMPFFISSLIAKIKMAAASSTVSDNIFVITTEPVDQVSGKCAGRLKLVRGRIDYVHYLDCDVVRKLKVVSTQDGVVIGDYRMDETSWISDTPDVLVIIDRVKGCEKLIYGRINGQWGLKMKTTTNVDECEKYKTKMKNSLDRPALLVKNKGFR